MSIGLEHVWAADDLMNRPAWGLSRTHGSMFFMEIGEQLPIENRKNPRGQWHFLVEMCHWRIETSDAVLVGSDDSPEAIDEVFGKLDPGVVIEASAHAPGCSLHLDFSSGIKLRTFTASALAGDEWIQWRLYLPNGRVWVANGSGSLVLQDGSDVATKS